MAFVRCPGDMDWLVQGSARDRELPGWRGRGIFQSFVPLGAAKPGKVTTVIVPSGFLADVFKRCGVATRIVANIVNLDRFTAAGRHQHTRADVAPQLLVTRNLEPIYDIDTALRVLQQVRKTFPEATMTICGLVRRRDRSRGAGAGTGDRAGRCIYRPGENEQIAALYQSADIMVNPSLADNMPNSVLEALASGVPVVRTRVGGVPYLVQHEKTALLVPPGDVDAMAKAVVRILNTRILRITW